MRIFRQAFEQLGGSRGRTNSDVSAKQDGKVVSAEEYFKESRKSQPLTRQFYTLLSALEMKLSSNNSAEIVTQLVTMYQQCIEYYDGKRDDIKYYFVDKIQNTVAVLQKQKKSKQSVEEQIHDFAPKLASTPTLLQNDDFVRLKKKEKSFKNTISHKIQTETEQQQVGDIVNQFHENVDKYNSQVQDIVEVQTQTIQERLRRRSTQRKSLSRSHTSNTDSQYFDPVEDYIQSTKDQQN